MPVASAPAKSSLPALSPLDDLPALIARINIHFQALVEHTLAELGLDSVLRPGMSPILFALYEQDDCIIKELAARAQRSAAAMNSLLGRLKKAGLVTLTPCEQDGRAVRVRLTQKGKDLEPQVWELHRRVVAAVERAFAPKEVTIATAVMKRLVTSLESQSM